MLEEFDEDVYVYSMGTDMEVGDVIQIDRDGYYRIVGIDRVEQTAFITRHED